LAVAFTADFFNLERAEQDPETKLYREGGNEAYYEGDEDEDGLGYYPDGVKRTLTDEQIAMFRHSETQALQRAREGVSSRRFSLSPPTHVHTGALKGRISRDGELSGDVSNTGVIVAKKRIKKKKRGSGHGKRYYSPDPQRRKRTWDVVETGLDGLDYGESGHAQAHTSPARQRRKITYDDG
jgi:hypothetical protein